MACYLVSIVANENQSIYFLKNGNDKSTVLTHFSIFAKFLTNLKKKNEPITGFNLFQTFQKHSHFFHQSETLSQPFSFDNLQAHRTNVKIVFIIDLINKNIDIYQYIFKRNNRKFLEQTNKLKLVNPMSVYHPKDRDSLFRCIKKLYNNGFTVNQQRNIGEYSLLLKLY
jgi:hypothetical protein